jgi:hypothetical protein
MCAICLCSWDWGVWWNFITALATSGICGLTIYIAYFARKQLEELEKTAKSDFYLRLKNDFFIKGTRDLFFLIDNKLLIYNRNAENDLDYFSLDETKLKEFSILKELLSDNKILYSDTEIQDLLLNPLEDIGLFYTNKSLSEKFIYEGFCYYIITVYENEQIKKYIDLLNKRDPTDNDYYSKLKDMYDRMKNYSK